MSTYKNGKIYIIRSPLSEKYYIGSTKLELSKRFEGHKKSYEKYQTEKRKKLTSFQLFDLGIDECTMELYESFPCNTIQELVEREMKIIEEHLEHCVNKQGTKNSKNMTAYNKHYLQTHQAEAKKRHKAYRDAHPERVCELKRQWYANNKAKVQAYEDTPERKAQKKENGRLYREKKALEKLVQKKT
jgi:GIY-YIG catalytic domain